MKKLKYVLFGNDPNYDYYEEDVYSMGLIPTIGMMLIILAFILLPMLFTSCTKVVYVDKNTNEVIETTRKGTDFINLHRVDDDFNMPDIYVDIYTDVLYAVYSQSRTVIMKPNGTCLTYTEWKERNK